MEPGPPCSRSLECLALYEATHQPIMDTLRACSEPHPATSASDLPASITQTVHSRPSVIATQSACLVYRRKLNPGSAYGVRRRQTQETPLVCTEGRRLISE